MRCQASSLRVGNIDKDHDGKEAAGGLFSLSSPLT
jgi:hypothetical protein